jgi:uncharacterized surface protein with fasciclin (FAS1) repeats
MKTQQIVSATFLVLALAAAPRVVLAGGSECSSCGCGSKASASEASAPAKAKDIVDTAVAAGSFKTLVAAVQAAGLVDTLKGDGPFTVFAPTDEAFAKLPKGTVEGLLKDKAALAKILTYHVVAGKVMAAQVVTMDQAMTVEGQNLKISAKAGDVRVGNARVTQADVEARNGVIHVIDTVLLP